MGEYVTLTGGYSINGIVIIPPGKSDNDSRQESSGEYPAVCEKCDFNNNQDQDNYDRSGDNRSNDYTTSGHDHLLWWELPGHGEKSEYCGEIRSVLACSNPDHRSNDNIRKVKRSCMKATCPICYEAWASKEAHVATDRIDKIEDLYATIGMPLGDLRHIIFSPPQAEAKELMKTKEGFKKLKKEALTVIKSAGVTGGLIVFHAERKHAIGGWYSSPHFHVLGYGYLENARAFSERTGGWIYKNAGKRRSIYSTILYQLSHCGIAIDRDDRYGGRPFQVVNWFGALSYYYVSKAETIKSETTIPCKVCGAPLHSYSRAYENADGSMNWVDTIDEGVYYLKVTTVYYELRHLKQLHERYEIGGNGCLQNRKKRKAERKQSRFVDKVGAVVTWATGDKQKRRADKGKKKKIAGKWIDNAKVGDIVGTQM